MNKILSLAGIIALTAIISTSAYAGNTGTGNPGKTMDQQTVYDNSAELRATLAADQAELNALMMGSNPDPKRVRTLSENISKSQDELRRQTGGYTTPMMDHGSSHMGMNCTYHNGQPLHMNGSMGGHMNGQMGGCC
jgi:hypothetical protein